MKNSEDMAEKNYGVSNKAKLLNITRQAEGQTYMRTMKNHRKSGIEKGLEDIVRLMYTMPRTLRI